MKKYKEIIRQWRYQKPIAFELTTNSILASLGQIYQLVLSGLLNILLARQLGVELMGVYLATQAMVGLIFVFTRLGVDVPAKREVSRDDSNLKPYFGSSLAIYLTMSTPVSLFVAIVAGTLLKVGTTQIIILMVLFIATTSLVGLNKSAMQALNRFDISAQVTIVTHTVYVIIVSLVLYIKPSLVFVMTTMVTAQMGILFVNILVLRKIGAGFGPVWALGMWRKIITQGLPVMLANTGEYINLRSDSIIISTFLGAAATGIYGVAYSFYLMVTIIVYLPSTGAFPTLARFSGKRNLQSYKRFSYKLNLIFFGISTLVAAILNILGPKLLIFLYGEEYQASLIPLRILTFSIPFVSLNRLMVQVLNASNLQTWTFRATITGAVFNVLVNLILIPRYGIVSAAYTTVITETLVWVITIFGLNRAASQATIHYSSSQIS